MSKPILCLDFDGVLHSYESGWKGADVIPDAPVAGAMEFLRDAVESFDLWIFSSRSNQPGGIDAMQTWLKEHLIETFGVEAARSLAAQIKLATEKPSAFLTIDDRAIQFTGIWPRPSDLLTFKPWNKREG